MLQLRQKGSTGAWWSAERDITVIAPGLFRKAFNELGGLLDPEDPQFTPQLLELQRCVGATEDELSQLAVAYGKLVQLIQTRQPLADHLPELHAVAWRAQAVLGWVVLRKLTDCFAQHYYHTIHQGEADPNEKALQAWLALVRRPRLSWWRRVVCRGRLLWMALRYPLGWSGADSGGG